MNSLGFLVVLLFAQSQQNELRYQVGLYQNWRNYESAQVAKSTESQRGLYLGFWHDFRNGTALSTFSDFYWHQDKIQLTTYRIALDSIRFRKVKLGSAFGDNYLFPSDPTDESPLNYRGLCFNLGWKNLTFQTLGGRVQDNREQTLRSFTKNQHLISFKGNYDSRKAHISTVLTHRADNPDNSPVLNNTVLGASGEFGIGENLLLFEGISFCAYKELLTASGIAQAGVRSNSAFASLTGISYTTEPLSARIGFNYTKAGYVSSQNNFFKDGQRKVFGLARYKISPVFGFAWSGGAYWSETGITSGNNFGSEISMSMPKLPVITIGGEFRTKNDTFLYSKELIAKLQMSKSFRYWQFEAGGQHLYYPLDHRHGNMVDLEIRYILQDRLNIEFGSGIHHKKDTIAEFARTQMNYRPFFWVGLSGNLGAKKEVILQRHPLTAKSAGIGITFYPPCGGLSLSENLSIEQRQVHYGDDSTKTSLGTVITYSPIPWISFSGNFGIERKKINQEQDSLFRYVGAQLDYNPFSWLDLSGNLRAGKVLEAHRELPQAVLNGSVKATASFVQGMKLVLDLSRQGQGDMTDDRAELALQKEGGLNKWGFVTIKGHTFQDVNRNRVFDKGDIPMPGVRVILDRRQEVLTNSKGRFSFPMVEKGPHEIEYAPDGVPANLGSFVSGRVVSVGLIGSMRIDFPIYEMGQISGQVFLDKNRNAIQDADECGVPNIIAFLDDYERATVTNAKGCYILANLEPRIYRVKIRNLPKDFELTTPECCEVDLALLPVRNTQTGAKTTTVNFGIAPKPRPVRKKVFE